MSAVRETGEWEVWQWTEVVMESRWREGAAWGAGQTRGRGDMSRSTLLDTWEEEEELGDWSQGAGRELLQSKQFHQMTSGLPCLTVSILSLLSGYSDVAMAPRIEVD